MASLDLEDNLDQMVDLGDHPMDKWDLFLDLEDNLAPTVDSVDLAPLANLHQDQDSLAQMTSLLDLEAPTMVRVRWEALEDNMDCLDLDLVLDRAQETLETRELLDLSKWDLNLDSKEDLVVKWDQDHQDLDSEDNLANPLNLESLESRWDLDLARMDNLV